MESKGLKVNLKMTKVMVCESGDEVIRSTIDPCKISGKMVIFNSVLCTKCDQWIHGKCFKLKKVTPSAARLFVCNKCNKATNGAGEVQQEIMCDEVETSCEEICYFGDRLNISAKREAAMTAGTRLGWKKFTESVV